MQSGAGRIHQRAASLVAVTLAVGTLAVGTLAVGTLAAGCGASGKSGRPASGPTTSPATAPAPRAPKAPAPRPWPKRAWVAVPVASIWDKLGSARPIDQAATTGHPDVTAWLTGLTTEQRRDLGTRMATQALLDDPLEVIGETGGWAHVLVVQQRGQVFRTGIAGWMPTAQITFRGPPATPSTATVAVPQARVAGLTVSYGTRLPALARHGGSLVVATPNGGRAVIPAQVARLSPPPSRGTEVVREAQRFMGLPYLWAGTSGFGLDCSGLTYLVYRQFGVTLPRDAADQARAGRPVAQPDLRPGDLVFFAFGGDGVIDHVGIYAGRGLMINAPETGRTIETVPLSSPGLMASYAGARRYLS